MTAPPLLYGEDLAFVHDVGFGGFARQAAPGVLEILAAAGVRSGRVVDLGCGSGIWAECLSYLAGRRAAGGALRTLFRRVYAALAPGGVFVFDVIGPGELGARAKASAVAKGDGWVVAVEKEEDRERGTLTRRITTFRRVGRRYRRSDETHRLRLYPAPEVLRELREAGFRARVTRSYGSLPLPRARAGFVARKRA